MSRYIDADKLQQVYKEIHGGKRSLLIDTEPTADVRENVKGRWIRHPEQKNIYGGKCVECSECGEKYMVQYIEDEKFCRNCGADMRHIGEHDRRK